MSSRRIHRDFCELLSSCEIVARLIAAMRPMGRGSERATFGHLLETIIGAGIWSHTETNRCMDWQYATLSNASDPFILTAAW